YYDILGISQTANDTEIKSAYRKLAKQYHPDHNPDDPVAEQKFKEIGEAYDVLKDPAKRANYDRFGSTDSHNNFHTQDFGFRNHSFTDIFGDIFGHGFHNTHRGPAFRQRFTIHTIITLEEAFLGKKHLVEYQNHLNQKQQVTVNIPPG